MSIKEQTEEDEEEKTITFDPIEILDLNPEEVLIEDLEDITDHMFKIKTFIKKVLLSLSAEDAKQYLQWYRDHQYHKISNVVSEFNQLHIYNDFRRDNFHHPTMHGLNETTNHGF